MPSTDLVRIVKDSTLPNTAYQDVQSLCRGFRAQAEQAGCAVLGGDITASSELSVSATSVGLAHRDRVLRRRGAKPGDSIFLTRPAGLTPAAFEYFLGTCTEKLTEDDEARLRGQFTAMFPMIELGRKLADSGLCTSCMDNTDGIGQSLSELCQASCASFVVDEEHVTVPPLVARIAEIKKKAPLDFLFNGGADFSLIGTLKGNWNRDDAKSSFGDSVEIVGHVEAGSGVRLLRHGVLHEVSFKGWNYFV